MHEDFATTSFYLAAFMAATGIVIDRFEVLPGGKYEFVFRDARARAVADCFLLGSDNNVNARRFVEEIKHLKSLMYDR